MTTQHQSLPGSEQEPERNKTRESTKEGNIFGLDIRTPSIELRKIHNLPNVLNRMISLNEGFLNKNIANDNPLVRELIKLNGTMAQTNRDKDKALLVELALTQTLNKRLRILVIRVMKFFFVP